MMVGSALTSYHTINLFNVGISNLLYVGIEFNMWVSFCLYQHRKYFFTNKVSFRTSYQKGVLTQDTSTLKAFDVGRPRSQLSHCLHEHQPSLLVCFEYYK